MESTYGEYHKQYFKDEKNKERISKFLTKKVKCECGKEISYVNMNKHKKTKNHIERLELINIHSNQTQ